MYLDKGPEYWAGWALAFYQWYSDASFMEILSAVSMEEISGFSQSELAAESGVPLRQIQLFEQCQRNINKTAAETLLRLSKVPCCRMEDLMER